MAATRILVPLLNPNETDARLVSLLVKEGQQVKEGDALGTLETTKSTIAGIWDRDQFWIG